MSTQVFIDGCLDTGTTFNKRPKLILIKYTKYLYIAISKLKRLMFICIPCFFFIHTIFS